MRDNDAIDDRRAGGCGGAEVSESTCMCEYSERDGVLSAFLYSCVHCVATCVMVSEQSRRHFGVAEIPLLGARDDAYN